MALLLRSSSWSSPGKGEGKQLGVLVYFNYKLEELLNIKDKNLKCVALLLLLLLLRGSKR